MADTCEVRARKVSKHHKKLLDDVKVDVGADNTSEALEALLDAYERNPGIVTGADAF